MNGLFAGFVKKISTPPFSYPIPATPIETLIKYSKFRIIRRYVKRYLNLFIKGQPRLEQQTIEATQKKILWIFLNMPQIGDTLMDLSSRILLEDKELDLYSQPNVCSLLKHDTWFSNCFSDKADLKGRDYDLVIIDVFNKRSLAIKNKYFKKTPFVTMAGFYDESEFNRTLFSFCRMHTLLNSRLPFEEVENSAVLTLSLPPQASKVVADSLKDKSGFIAITTGGLHPFRTYDKWVDVIDLLLKRYGDITVVLVGSEDSGDLLKKISDKVRVIDFTEKLSIFETADVIRRARLMICADGGLLHIANAMGISSIGLFARTIQPNMRMTGFKNSRALYSPLTVSHISPEEIVETFDSLNLINLG